MYSQRSRVIQVASRFLALATRRIELTIHKEVTIIHRGNLDGEEDRISKGRRTVERLEALWIGGNIGMKRLLVLKY